MLKRSEEEWKKLLTADQYAILREKATEVPFTGKFLHNKAEGTYTCFACGEALFSSDTKFDSGSGWPSFYDVIDKGAVKLQKDTSHGMERVEVVCANCGSHLGHVFSDAYEQPGGQRYCINSAALNFKNSKNQ